MVDARQKSIFTVAWERGKQLMPKPPRIKVGLPQEFLELRGLQRELAQNGWDAWCLGPAGGKR
jgi:hypothetical protein